MLQVTNIKSIYSKFVEFSLCLWLIRSLWSHHKIVNLFKNVVSHENPFYKILLSFLLPFWKVLSHSFLHTINKMCIHCTWSTKKYTEIFLPTKKLSQKRSLYFKLSGWWPKLKKIFFQWNENLNLFFFYNFILTTGHFTLHGLPSGSVLERSICYFPHTQKKQKGRHINKPFHIPSLKFYLTSLHKAEMILATRSNKNS